MKPLGFFHRVMLMLNMIVMLLFVVAAYSYLVSPKQSVVFPFLGLMFPVFMVANLFFTVYWLCFRKWLRFLVVVFSFLICWKSVSSYVPIHIPHAEAPAKGVIKILSYNVMGFGYKDHTAKKPNPILRYIIDSGADIVCLQEYMTGISPDGILTEKKIRDALKMYPYYYKLPLTRNARYTVGLGIFSKYPILKSRKVRYDSAFNGSTLHEIRVDGKTVYVINNHLESFKLTMGDRSRYAEFIGSISSGVSDNLIETMQRKLGAAFRIRAEQAEIVAEEIAALKDERIVVCGDFNDTPVSYAYRTVRGRLSDAFEESGCGVGATYNQNFFRFRLDHILFSQHISVCETKIDRIPFSDHYPVWCRVEIR
ncbi:MAG: endonuclease/exonuclease/phosphatase family protein [Tannerella sp.]|jgi:endonuclease/exonuclease/phosphatase family metal-dependent hydrolase|nr:endonuclease/exonuclease/phosphatase family protein [Tannerella sp.]